MTDADPGPLIGRGRAADVFDIGDGRVLRRNRSGASTAIEAEVMRHVRAQGYPVPVIHGASGPDLIMERVDGPTMLNAFGTRPWNVHRWARMLADLLRQLEGLPATGLALPQRFGPGEHLVHGDLHPDNVILSERGPVVIDWPNAALGPAGVDAASSWLILAASEIEATGIDRMLQQAGRSYFVRRFLGHVGRDRLHPTLGVAARHRLRDRNLRPTEAEAIRRLLEREGVEIPSD